MKRSGVSREDAYNWNKWRSKVKGEPANPCTSWIWRQAFWFQSRKQFPKLLKLAVRYPEDSSNSTQLIHYIINMKSSHVQCKALVWEATLTKQWREYVTSLKRDHSKMRDSDVHLVAALILINIQQLSTSAICSLLNQTKQNVVIIHADDCRRVKHSSMSVCLSVCRHDRTK